MSRPRILVAVTVRSGYFRNILRGIYRYAALRGGFDLVQMEPPSVKSEVNPSHYQGAIACAGASGHGVERFITAGLPVVDVSNWDPSRQVPAITSDDEAVGMMAADHLLGLGHHNFAYAGLKQGVYSQRLRRRVTGSRNTNSTREGTSGVSGSTSSNAPRPGCCPSRNPAGCSSAPIRMHCMSRRSPSRQGSRCPTSSP